MRGEYSVLCLQTQTTCRSKDMHSVVNCRGTLGTGLYRLEVELWANRVPRLVQGGLHHPRARGGQEKEVKRSAEDSGVWNT